MPKYNKVILAVLDGFGIASPSPGNAITSAKPAFYQELIAHYPVKVLQASGPAVGLPWRERGNSEVGHLNLGAGRVVTQELQRINSVIASGAFYKNEALLRSMRTAKDNGSTLHLIGLIGTGAVHAYEQHMYALIGMAQDQGVPKIALHIFTDGRDAPPRAALSSVQKLEERLAEWPNVKIASVTGRFYAMDRAGHVEQTESAVEAIVLAGGEKFESAVQAVEKRYAMNISDEMIPPSVVSGDLVKPGDAAVFFNFRNDRVIQLVKVFLSKTTGVQVTTLTSYSPEFKVDVAFLPNEIKDSLGEIVSKQGFKQFHAAESEKFAHVTYFFNGHRHEPWPGEERFIVKSPSANAKNYLDVPEMSARPLTDAVVKRIKEEDDKFILVNYANGDMVGHTGNVRAGRQAVLVLDECLKRLAEAASEAHALLVITADHGNCENMIEENNGAINTEHSANPVPLVFFADDLRLPQVSNLDFYSLAGVMPEGILPDVAPTILNMLGLDIPEAMTGKVIEV